MINIAAVVTGQAAIAPGRFEKVTHRLAREVDRTTGEAAAMLMTQIVVNASGPPGPEIQSGEYVGSWRLERINAAEGSAWIVITDSDYAHRLEYGFVGVDSLGRRYHQEPRPHIRPAMEQARQYFPQKVQHTMLEVISGV